MVDTVFDESSINSSFDSEDNSSDKAILNKVQQKDTDELEFPDNACSS